MVLVFCGINKAAQKFLTIHGLSEFFGMDKNLTETCEVTMYSNNITDFALLESNDEVKYN